MENPTRIVSVFTYEVEYEVVNPKLPTMVTATAHICGGYEFIVRSHPYGFGMFTADGWTFGFGGKGYWLNTTVLEDAIAEAERRLLLWAKQGQAWYQAVIGEYPEEQAE